MKFFGLLLIVPLLFIVALIISCDNNSSADTPVEQEPPRFVFHHQSQSGMLEPIGGDRFILMVEGISPIITFFGHEPNPFAGNLETNLVIRNFLSDLSNPLEALLEMRNEDGTLDVIGLNLHDANIDQEMGIIEYEVSMSAELPDFYLNPNDPGNVATSVQNNLNNMLEINQDMSMELSSNSLIYTNVTPDAGILTPPTCTLLCKLKDCTGPFLTSSCEEPISTGVCKEDTSKRCYIFIPGWWCCAQSPLP